MGTHRTNIGFAKNKSTPRDPPKQPPQWFKCNKNNNTTPKHHQYTTPMQKSFIQNTNDIIKKKHSKKTQQDMRRNRGGEGRGGWINVVPESKIDSWPLRALRRLPWRPPCHCGSPPESASPSPSSWRLLLGFQTSNASEYECYLCSAARMRAASDDESQMVWQSTHRWGRRRQQLGSGKSNASGPFPPAGSLWKWMRWGVGWGSGGVGGAFAIPAAAAAARLPECPACQEFHPTPKVEGALTNPLPIYSIQIAWIREMVCVP